MKRGVDGSFETEFELPTDQYASYRCRMISDNLIIWTKLAEDNEANVASSDGNTSVSYHIYHILLILMVAMH